MVKSTIWGFTTDVPYHKVIYRFIPPLFFIVKPEIETLVRQIQSIMIL